MDRKAEGEAREDQACRHLQRAGLALRDRNVRYRVGEIDLVMDHAEVLVFVEVRYRRSERFGGASHSVERGKQQRLARAAACYLSAHPGLARRPCRFDVVAIGADGLDWIRDAFRIDGA